MNTQQLDHDRRRHNRTVARALIGVGCPVFPCSPVNKRPLIPGWKFLAEKLTDDGREAIRAKFVDVNKFEPAFVGSTLDLARAKQFFREFPDAIYGIPCGLAGLLIVDADEKHDGPNLLAKFVEANGGWPEGVVIIPTQGGGRHVYLRNDAGLGNSAGAMKKLGCDIRGNLGLCIAPASWRTDDKKYGSLDDLTRFMEAFSQETLPATPDFVKAAIGQANSGSANRPNSNKEESETMAELRKLGLGDGADADIAEELGAENILPWYLHHLENSGVNDDTCSAHRYRFLQMVRAMLPELSAAEGLSILCFAGDNGLDCVGEYAGDRKKDKDESGVFTMANFARDWIGARHSKFSSSLPTNGSAFGVAEDC